MGGDGGGGRYLNGVKGASIFFLRRGNLGGLSEC